jgi:hypothetical protein
MKEYPSSEATEKNMSRKTCPCEFGNPCSLTCTCAHPVLSGGCRRCCKYGSKEQQENMAKILIEKEKIKAPIGCVIDDKGEILKGTWTRKNGGHGDFWWRFETEAVSDDD